MTTVSDDELDLLTTAEVAEILRKDRDYVSRQCKAGAIKAKKLGDEWRISRAALRAFLAGDPVTPPTRTRLSARQRRRAAT